MMLERGDIERSRDWRKLYSEPSDLCARALGAARSSRDEAGGAQGPFPLGCRFAVVSALAGRAIVSLQRCAAPSRPGVGERLVRAR